MADSFLALSRDDKYEALLNAGLRSNRPPYLLEKDVWVVWTLRALPLNTDYAQMREAGVLMDDATSFGELMQTCAEIEARINRAALPL